MYGYCEKLGIVGKVILGIPDAYGQLLLEHNGIRVAIHKDYVKLEPGILEGSVYGKHWAEATVYNIESDGRVFYRTSSGMEYQRPGDSFLTMYRFYRPPEWVKTGAQVALPGANNSNEITSIEGDTVTWSNGSKGSLVQLIDDLAAGKLVRYTAPVLPSWVKVGAKFRSRPLYSNQWTTYVIDMVNDRIGYSRDDGKTMGTIPMPVTQFMSNYVAGRFEQYIPQYGYIVLGDSGVVKVEKLDTIGSATNVLRGQKKWLVESRNIYSSETEAYQELKRKLLVRGTQLQDQITRVNERHLTTPASTLLNGGNRYAV